MIVLKLRTPRWTPTMPPDIDDVYFSLDSDWGMSWLQASEAGYRFFVVEGRRDATLYLVRSLGGGGNLGTGWNWSYKEQRFYQWPFQALMPIPNGLFLGPGS